MGRFPCTLAMALSLVAAALASSAPPALAGSPVDVEELKALIQKSGTDIVYKECKDKTNVGSYSYSKQKRINRLTVCTDNIDLKDNDALWELLAHEATHIMQRCNEGSIIKDEFHPRIVRELKAQAPHYASILSNQYRHADWMEEAEAYVMELQRPELVKDWFTDFCLTTKKAKPAADSPAKPPVDPSAKPSADTAPEPSPQPPAGPPAKPPAESKPAQTAASPSPANMKGILYLEPRR